MMSGERARIRDGFAGQRMLVLPRPIVRAALGAGLVSDLLPTDVGCFPHARSHYVDRPRGAEQLIVIYCARGRGWAQLQSCRMDVAAGQVLLVPPGRPHVYAADESVPWTIYWFHAAGAGVRQIHAVVTDGGARPVLDVGEDATTVVLFEEMFEALHRGYGPQNLLLASGCGRHMLGRFGTLASRDTSGGAAQRVERAIRFMSQRVACSVSVAQLARMANLSPSHLSALFKRQTGYPPLEFFIRLKMRRAAELLDHTTLPVKLVAAELGYDDPLYFSRLFRRIYELSPVRYRAVKKG